LIDRFQYYLTIIQKWLTFYWAALYTAPYATESEQNGIVSCIHYTVGLLLEIPRCKQ